MSESEYHQSVNDSKIEAGSAAQEDYLAGGLNDVQCHTYDSRGAVNCEPLSNQTSVPSDLEMWISLVIGLAMLGSLLFYSAKWVYEQIETEIYHWRNRKR